MSINVDRLLVQLNNTGLQNKDTPLYQFLNNLLGKVKSIDSSVTNISSSPSSVTNNITNQGMFIDESIEETNIFAIKGDKGDPGNNAMTIMREEVYSDDGILSRPITNVDPYSIVTGSGTATQVAFWTASNTLNSDSNLFWDNTNKKLISNGILIGNQIINLDRINNSTQTTYINDAGYSDGYTQFRNLDLRNGKGSSVLFIDGVNNRVGFNGITSLSAAMHGKGLLRLDSANNTNPTASIGHLSGTDSGGISLYTGGVLTTFIATNQNSFIQGGNVGIGTGSPSSLLQVDGITTITRSAVNALSFQLVANGGNLGGSYIQAYNGVYNPLEVIGSKFGIYVNGTTLSTEFFASGGVSIGNTTDPGSANVLISGNIALAGASVASTYGVAVNSGNTSLVRGGDFQVGGTSTDAYGVIGIASGTNTGHTNRGGYFKAANGTTNYSLQVDNSSSSAALVVFGSGGVSIGNTTDPGAGALSVNGTNASISVNGTSTETISLSSTALGVGVRGGGVIAGRNTSGSGAPGFIDLADRSGSDNYLFFDTSQVLRVNSTVINENGGACDLVGTIIGFQTEKNNVTLTYDGATNNNNINPSTGNTVRFTNNGTNTGNAILTGLSGGVAGRMLFLFNDDTKNLVLQQENVNSTAANRFYDPIGIVGARTVVAGQGIFVYYSGDASRWVIID